MIRAFARPFWSVVSSCHCGMKDQASNVMTLSHTPQTVFGIRQMDLCGRLIETHYGIEKEIKFTRKRYENRL